MSVYDVISGGHPNKRGGSVGNRLEGPPHPELQWIPGHLANCLALCWNPMSVLESSTLRTP